LSGIEEQVRHVNIQHILDILERSQSLFIKQFKTLRDELNKEIERSDSNAGFLQLLVEPCQELEESELVDVPKKLPNIIFLIRVISLNSEYYNNKKNTERLFSYLSNEIINFCKSKVDIKKILDGAPRFGIRISDMSIDCCLAYKLIFKRLLEQFSMEDFKRTWMFDEATIFSQINIFIQRLFDIIEICDTIIVFGRIDETMKIPPLSFGCSNAKEFMAICKDMEERFSAGLDAIKSSMSMILDVHNRVWYQEMSNFKMLIRSLEEVVDNLMVNLFLNIENIEEALDVLTALYNFCRRRNLQPQYHRKVDTMWKMFQDEIVETNKDITRTDNQHLGCLPKNAGKALMLHIRMKKCERLKDLLVNAHYLPKVAIIETALRMYENTMENIKARIERYNTEWANDILPQPNVYLNSFLINRSPTHGGLLECNIDRNILPLFEEAKYFDFMEIPLPSTLTGINPKAKRTVGIFNKVCNLVLVHNMILCSLSDKERLLFKEHIKVMGRKISPGLFRLTYNDEVTDAYVADCLKHINELQHFVKIYKIINGVNVKMFETISNDSIMKVDHIKTVGTLSRFKLKLKDTRNESIRVIANTYRMVMQYIIVIYDGFENHLSGEMAERWMNFIRKIDALAEYALISCCRNTLSKIVDLLKGTNNMKPNPILVINVTLEDRKIIFEPSLEEVSSSLQNIHRNVIRSMKLLPRLNEKFELPKDKEIRDFHEVITGDPECNQFRLQINDIIEENMEKISDYLDGWNLFRYVWEIDIDQFMVKYQNKGLELKEFESSMSKYFDVANQVLMQDTITTINFLTLNCSKLKMCVLDFIGLWKQSYKETLCSATLKKLEIHNITLTTRITKLSERPLNTEELQELLDLQEQSVKEQKLREAEMAEIRDYYGYLGKLNLFQLQTALLNVKLQRSTTSTFR